MKTALTEIDYFYTRPLNTLKWFVFGSVGIHICSYPFFVHESGQYISVKEMYRPDYKPCLAVNSDVSGCRYVYNFTDDILKRFKLSGDQLKCSTMDINKYYKLINWMVKNLPWRNRHK